MTSFDNLNEILEKQKKAHLREGPLSVETRKEWIDRCIALLIKYQNEIAEAISEDFGHRSTESSLLADVAGSIGSLKSAKENIIRSKANLTSIHCFSSHNSIYRYFKIRFL